MLSKPWITVPQLRLTLQGWGRCTHFCIFWGAWGALSTFTATKVQTTVVHKGPTPNVLELILLAFSGLFFFFNVKGCKMWLAVIQMCTGICRGFVWLFVKYPFKMAMVTVSILALFPSNGHKHIHTHTPDHCHVAKSCANECIGIMCSLTLVVLSNFFAEFSPF